jgi:hypothetical protein
MKSGQIGLKRLLLVLESYSKPVVGLHPAYALDFTAVAVDFFSE